MWLVLLAILIAIWLWPQVWERFVSHNVLIELSVVTPVVEFGDSVVFRCRMINTSSLPCPRIHCSIRLPEQLDSDNLERPDFVEFSTYILPHQEADITLELRTRKRGYARLVQADFVLVDGLGIRRVYITCPLNTGFVVLPKRGSELPVPQRLMDLIGDVRTRRFYNEDTSLLVGIRPYQQGDPMRYVSWYATARTQELMVKQFGYTTTARCIIIFSGSEYSDMLDLLCERAVRLTDYLLGAGLAVGMYANLFDSINRSFYDPPSSAPEQLERIRHRMGCVEAIPFMSLTYQLHSAIQFTSPGDMIVVLAGRVSNGAAAALNHFQRSRPSVYLYTVVDDDVPRPKVYGIPTYVERVDVRTLSESKVGEQHA